MMRFLISAVAAACLLTAQEEPTLRMSVNLVRLLVTAKDAAGNAVANLAPAEFRISDNGVPQKIAFFERQTEQPLSVSLLIDNSGSTAKDLRFEVDSIGRFVRDLLESGNPDDRAALYSFNYQVVKLTAFTRQQAPIEHALHQLKGEAGTSLYDAIYLSANEFYGRQGRHVMVIVTDGGDTTSSKDYSAALEAAQRADAVIFPVLVVPIENEAGRNIGGENALTTLAEGTGGRVFLPSLGGSLDRAFEQIINELRTQYLLAYYPHNAPPTRNGFHRVSVGTAHSGLQVIARNGYYESSAPSAHDNANASSRGPRF